MNISTHFIHLALLLHLCTSQRQYASNLFSLIDTLKKTGYSIQNISANLHYSRIEKLPPLAYIPSDVLNFHRQVTTSWSHYQSTKANIISYPPTNVNPMCNSFTYQPFYWSPSQWTSITNQYPLNNTDFQMIHLKMPSETHITISRTDSSKNALTIPRRSLQETFLFTSKILSYFYEKYAHISFKLLHHADNTLTTDIINCTISLNDLPTIQEVIQRKGDTRVQYTTPCILEKFVRIKQVLLTRYAIYFPTSKIQNIEQQPLKRYINITTLSQALDFHWPYINQTTYKLIIDVSQKRQSLPTIWWILPYTNSLLLYHKNLFAPWSINTRATTYSYALQNKHYYITGRCIPPCQHNTLQQKVREIASSTSSWQLPTQPKNNLIPTCFYCLPHCGAIETHMKLYHPYAIWWPSSFSDRCSTLSSNFTTVTAQLNKIFPTLQHLNPLLNRTIYSYDTKKAIAMSGPLRNYRFEPSYLNRRLAQKSLKFETLWHSTYRRYKPIEKAITESFSFHDESLCHLSELLYYSKSKSDIARNTFKMSTAAYLETSTIHTLQNEYFFLHDLFTQLQNHTEHIYSLKYMTNFLQAIQNRTDLQSNLIYSHKIHEGYLQNKPILRIWPQELHVFLTPSHVNNQSKQTDTKHALISHIWPTVQYPPNVTSTLTAPYITRTATKVKPTVTTLHEISTAKTTNIYALIPASLQTVRDSLTKIMKSFTYIVNHSYFIFNSIHITTSRYIQHFSEILTAPC